MKHTNKMSYLIGAGAVTAALSAFGAPLGALLPFAFVLICPLMMVVMMRGMRGMHGQVDHAGHGCEHDPAREAESSTSGRH